MFWKWFPTGYIQTGGGPNGSAGCTYYTISVAERPDLRGQQLRRFPGADLHAHQRQLHRQQQQHPDDGARPSRGKTHQGNTVTVTFTVPSGMNDQLTLVSYIAPASTFNSATAYQQQIFDVATGIFTPGVPFAHGPDPELLLPDRLHLRAADQRAWAPPTTARTAATYSTRREGRLLGSDNGGTQACGSGQVAICKGDFATPSFWLAAKGQTLINTFNSPNSSTAPGLTNLSQWLVTTFPNLYGAGTGTHSLAGLTNAQVATNFGTKFSGADQQVLSTALSVYATSTSLDGTGANNLAKTDGFTISTGGSGMHVYNVLTNGAAFGVANNTTAPVLQLLVELNAQTGTGAALSSGANTVFTAINLSTGHLSLTATGADSSNVDVALLNSIGDLSSGTLLVYVDNSQSNVSADEQAAIDKAIATLNGDLSAFGVSLVDDSADPSGLISAEHYHLAGTFQRHRRPGGRGAGRHRDGRLHHPHRYLELLLRPGQPGGCAAVRFPDGRHPRIGTCPGSWT